MLESGRLSLGFLGLLAEPLSAALRAQFSKGWPEIYMRGISPKARARGLTRCSMRRCAR